MDPCFHQNPKAEFIQPFAKSAQHERSKKDAEEEEDVVQRDEHDVGDEEAGDDGTFKLKTFKK